VWATEAYCDHPGLGHDAQRPAIPPTCPAARCPGSHWTSAPPLGRGEETFSLSALAWQQRRRLRSLDILRCRSSSRTHGRAAHAAFTVTPRLPGRAHKPNVTIIGAAHQQEADQRHQRHLTVSLSAWEHSACVSDAGLVHLSPGPKGGTGSSLIFKGTDARPEVSFSAIVGHGSGTEARDGVDYLSERPGPGAGTLNRQPHDYQRTTVSVGKVVTIAMTRHQQRRCGSRHSHE